VKLSRYKQAKLNSQNLLNITTQARGVNREGNWVVAHFQSPQRTGPSGVWEKSHFWHTSHTVSDEKIGCSFCGKPAADVAKLISSPKERPGTYICDGCVRVCAEILEDEKPTTPPQDPPTVIPIWLARMIGGRKRN
jgi:hypothetical protein